jgi:hypothetical protein
MECLFQYDTTLLLVESPTTASLTILDTITVKSATVG